MFSKHFFATIPLFTLLVLNSCEQRDPTNPHFASVQAPIFGGAYEAGYESVVFLARIAGGSFGGCTAAIVGPRLVLTAYHCVEDATPSQLFVVVGGNPQRSRKSYTVAEIRLPENPGVENGNDIAFVVLNESADETSLAMASENPESLTGSIATAIGYGQRGDGGSGLKFRVQTQVTEVDSRWIYVNNAICQGDSGGPLLGADNKIYGVVSFGFTTTGAQPTCGGSIGTYVHFSRHRDFISSTLEEFGQCLPEEEICDGKDNDCNGTIDDDCEPFGETCRVSSRCEGGLCAETSVGKICTRACDPQEPILGCPEGFYCSVSSESCGAFCIPGVKASSPKDFGDICETDTDCLSLYCAQTGESKRCSEFCQPNSGGCFRNEVCLSTGDACGACVNLLDIGGDMAGQVKRGLGEPCTQPSECEGGVCNVEGYCTVSCGECPTGFICQSGFCNLDIRQPLGGICNTGADCKSGQCATGDRGGICTSECTNEQCPGGFSCTAGLCMPSLKIVNASCVSGNECVSGLCLDGVCSQPCDAEQRCSKNQTCIRLTNAQSSSSGSDFEGVCRDTSDQQKGGCNLYHHSASTPLWSFLVMAVLLIFRVRQTI